MTYRTHLLICLFGVAVAARAGAVPLTAGNVVNLAGTTSALRPELAGTVIEDVTRPLSIDIGAGLIFTGTIQDRVVREDVSGTLDFYYKLTVDANSGGFARNVSRTDFTGWTTDVD